ncbi:MAG: DUF1097 domain-containing protein [Chloroflexi bacterium]|nr:DUF1097 domain-containing protein [Chloroflexota bacterium]
MKLKFGPLALSVGVLAAIWTYASIKLGLSTWAAFVGWALFFVAGADTKALSKAGVPIVVGVLFGYLSLYGLKLEGEMAFIGVSVAVGVAALLLILLMNWAPTALAPAAVAGFATFFGFTLVKTDVFDLNHVLFTLLALAIGLALGWLSVSLPAWFSKPAQA